jgi:inosose dehydratase
MAAHSPGRLEWRRMPIHIGTAPDSWGVWFASDPRQTPWQRFLDEVVAAGYDAIELGPFGYLPTEPRRVAEALDSRSLRLAGGTITGQLSAADGWDALRQTTAAICDVLVELDAHFLVLLDASSVETGTIAPELDEVGWRRLRENVHRMGEYTARRDVAAVFHPHADTTVQFEPHIERFLELTDPSLVNLCLDLGHHAYAGGDPVRFFGQHHARIPYIHLKDVDPARTAQVRAEGWPLSRAVTEGAFADLGQGCVDFQGLNDVATKVGFDGWGIVEQDLYPAPFDKPLPIARRNREYLRDIGLG